ncbi:hypothetical protein RXV86_15715 [Alisedimentitalea sp. MJ-SS2]|uniref:hypothetical protein n=1 Tax=Aliisedimentitalea sp. MJ-SS2 TaxID=3049795 RepID=UPI0029089BC2|nr:hypothetical protein [Alisedimentitalea sp. MJ-SS2]MDU8928839.1 hypothetical protein [Alisedimentitalea sp. MJ-SS2]
MSGHRDEDTSKFPLLGRLFLWADNPKSVNKMVYGLYTLCAALFAADFLYHKHVYLAVEEFPGFYALYGFFMCALLVICAKGMRVFLKRDEDYYTPYDVESEEYPEDQLEKVDHDG